GQSTQQAQRIPVQETSIPPSTSRPIGWPHRGLEWSAAVYPSARTCERCMHRGARIHPPCECEDPHAARGKRAARRLRRVRRAAAQSVAREAESRPARDASTGALLASFGNDDFFGPTAMTYGTTRKRAPTAPTRRTHRGWRWGIPTGDRPRPP